MVVHLICHTQFGRIWEMSVHITGNVAATAATGSGGITKMRSRETRRIVFRNWCTNWSRNYSCSDNSTRHSSIALLCIHLPVILHLWVCVKKTFHKVQTLFLL